MITYLIMSTSFTFILSLCQVLKVGKLIRLKELKKLYPEATLKDIESFEKTQNQIIFSGTVEKINRKSLESFFKLLSVLNSI